jgi:hypothetical protein
MKEAEYLRLEMRLKNVNKTQKITNKLNCSRDIFNI